MKVVVAVLSLLGPAASLNAQLLPVPLEVGISKYGKPEVVSPALLHHLPFGLDTANAIDTIYQCEEQTFCIRDTTFLYSQCDTYKWPLPDTMLSLFHGYSSMIWIPYLNRSRENRDHKYYRINDTVWMGVDSFSRKWRNKTVWHLDKRGLLKKVDITTSADSIVLSYHYYWHSDGRIRNVTWSGSGYCPNEVCDTIFTYEYIYDEAGRLSTFCQHAGFPYPFIADSVQRWTRYLTAVYRDSFPNSNFYMLSPPGSSLRELVNFNYGPAGLSDILFFGWQKRVDTLSYDDHKRLQRICCYSEGNKTTELEFEYNPADGKLRKSRVLRYYTPENSPASSYTLTYEYDQRGRLSEIVLPPDDYPPNTIRYSYRLTYPE
jgi:hypothetical protein